MYATKYNTQERIWSGPELRCTYNPDVSVGQVILSALAREPSRIGQVSHDSGVSLTNNEIRLRSIRCAQNLLKQELQQGDVIGLVAKNSENLAPVVFGALICGNPINPLDVSFGADEITHMFSTTKPKLVFCDARNFEVVKMSLEALNSEAQIYLIDGRIPGVKSVEDFLKTSGTESEFLPPSLHRGGKEIAVMLCSSGTTGRPKAVCLSHQLVLDAQDRFFPRTGEDVYFSFSTLYWISGFSLLVCPSLKGAKRIISDKQFTPELYLKIVEEHGVTCTLTPPSQLAMILNCDDLNTGDLSSMKFFLTGGSFVPKQLAEAMSKQLENGLVILGYGMSELGNVCSMDIFGNRFDSVGLLSPNCQVKILDDCGERLAINEVGEICVRNKYIFTEYYGNPQATREILDNEGWIQTGDIGFIDNDGYLHICNRKKEIIKYKNFHVYPSEIETEILTIPGVKEACVCGIPDLVATDLPAAAVIKEETSNLNELDVYNHVASKMSHHKHLTGGVYFLESFPMTASGKVQRHVLRDHLTKLFKSSES